MEGLFRAGRVLLEPLATGDFSGAALIAFTSSALFASIDLNDFIKQPVADGRKIQTVSMLKSMRCWLFLIANGLVAALIVAAIRLFPDWRLIAVFSLNSQDWWSQGLAVGASTALILRSRFFELQGRNIGGEYLYEPYRRYVRAGLITATFDRRDRIHRRYETSFTGVAAFAPELRKYLQTHTEADGDRIQREALAEFDAAHDEFLPALEQTDSEANWTALHNALIRVTFDYCPLDEVETRLESLRRRFAAQASPTLRCP